MANQSLESIASQIENNSRRPILIAMEGFGGSGKTTLAQRLAYLLGSFIVKERLIERSWDKAAFDRRRLEAQVLLPLSEQRQAAYQRLIWDTNTLSEPMVIPDVRFVIVEGISSYHPSIARYYDYKIWVDTPMALAKRRGHTRDGSNENADNWDLWAENDLAYQDQYHPELQADFTISNA